MRLRLAFVLTLAALCGAGSLFAGDWPQWRGPQRNGLAPESPRLLEQFPAGGPKRVWSNDEIRAGSDAGYGSPTVSQGKVYVYQNLNMPPVRRVLSRAVFDRSGYAAGMPDELAQAVEQARLSEARRTLDPRGLDPWVRDWMDTHMKADQRKWRGAVQARLRAGTNALPIDLLAKLVPIIDRSFANETELNRWLDENAFDEASQKRIRQVCVPTDEKSSNDVVWCLDAATGKTDWRRTLSSQWFYYPASTTPTVVDGKCYVLNSEARVFCLDAKTGEEVWKSPPLGSGGFHHNRSSSPLLVDGVLVVLTEGCLAGVDAADGKVLWNDGKLKNPQSSAACWTTDGKSYAIVNASGKLCCVDPKDGLTKWSVPSEGASTPTVAGDFAAVAGGGKVGLACFKLSVEKAEKLWGVAWKDAHSGPIIFDGCVYALGEAFYDRGQGRAVCVGLETGKVAWSQVVGPPQHSSPLLADGKIIAVSGSQLLMIRATPEEYAPLGVANVGAEMWPSPAVADGKVFVRTARGIACFDLAKP